MNNHDEILDLVDENDCVIGQITRSLARERKIRTIRAIHVFLINDQGQLWIPRRAAHKETLPLALDSSASGLVQSGETYQEGLARELYEELRIDLATVTYTCIGSASPYAGDFAAFSKVYEIRTDKVPSYNPDDFCSYDWLYPHQIIQLIENGTPSKSDLPKFIRTLYINTQ